MIGFTCDVAYYLLDEFLFQSRRNVEKMVFLDLTFIDSKMLAMLTPDGTELLNRLKLVNSLQDPYGSTTQQHGQLQDRS